MKSKDKVCNKHVKYSDFAILLISKNYKNSEICLNEMGAVWAIDKTIRTYVLPGMRESAVGWLIDTKMAQKINDPVALTAFYKDITDFYHLQPDMVLWTAQATKFLNSLK